MVPINRMQTQPTGGAALRILLLDDNPDDRDLAMRELCSTFPDADVHPIGDRAAWEQALEQGDFDVLVTDYALRWANGIDVLRAAKQRNPERPVIMFTNSGNEEVAVEAMKAGLDDYILKKPSYFVRLSLAVRSAVERAAARRDAEEALHAREEFLAVAAHELRTPLTSVTTSVQLIDRRLASVLGGLLTQQGPTDSRLEDVTTQAHATHAALEPLMPLLARTQRELARLDRFVTDLMDVARLRRNEFTLALRVTDLRAIVTEAVEAQRAIEPARPITVVQPRQPVFVRVDGDRIAQVLANYLSNANKYAPPQTALTVEIQPQPASVRVVVRDAGPGLPAEELARIWQPYYRVGGMVHRRGSSIGLGLGLYLCQTIIAQHGGTVGVESALGAGSTFWFTLPLAPAQE